VVEDDHGAGFNVGRHRTEGNRKTVKGFAGPDKPSQFAQGHEQVLSGNEGIGHFQPRFIDAEFGPSRRIEFFGLCPIAALLSGQRIAEEQIPIGLFQPFQHFLRRVSCAVEAADDRSHTGPGDVVDLDVQFLEHANHPDMSDPAGPSAGQHQADSGALS
jgi:hypothetical protein